MNRRRAWMPLRRVPLAAAGVALTPAVGVAPTHAGGRRSQWHNANARPSGCFRLETDLDDHVGNRLKPGNWQEVGGRTVIRRAAVGTNRCSAAVDHCRLLELASDIATARGGWG